MHLFLLANHAGDSLEQMAVVIFSRSFQMSATVDFAIPCFHRLVAEKAVYPAPLILQASFPE